MHGLLRRVVAAAGAICVGAVAGGVLCLPGAASAHVTLDGTAPQGGSARVTVRVPNESDTAATVKVELVLPGEPVIPFVSVMPVPGWSVATERTKLPTPAKSEVGEVTEAVARIVWTAVPGGGIKSGEFMEFPISLAGLPKVDRLVFKALQTYSDGQIARWIEEPPVGGPEPENPAPVLTLTPAGRAELAPVASGTESSAALWTAVAALVVGVGGLVLGALALIRSRRT